MAANLILELSKVQDFRANDGKRHPLWFILLIAIMGTMSGYLGYRALGDFVERHRQELIETFDIPKQRVPSYSTIRRVLQGIDFDQFSAVFNAWAAQYVPVHALEWVAIDGKSIGGTVKNAYDAQQNFQSIVSVFSVQRGVVLGLDQLENKKSSEIVTVQTLLQALDLKGVVFSLDALHCQKNG